MDWSDIQNTDPVLGADIYENNSGEKGRKLRNGQWHHTQKELNIEEGRKVHDFTFENLILCLAAKMSFGLSVQMDTILVKQNNGDNYT